MILYNSNSEDHLEYNSEIFGMGLDQYHSMKNNPEEIDHQKINSPKFCNLIVNHEIDLFDVPNLDEMNVQIKKKKPSLNAYYEVSRQHSCEFSSIKVKVN